MTAWAAPTFEQTLCDCMICRRHNTRTGNKGWAFRGTDGKSDTVLYATFGGCREAACRAGYQYPTMSKGASLPYYR